MKRWITGKSDIDDEWDKFQLALKNNGTLNRIEILQKAYDIYNSSGLE